MNGFYGVKISDVNPTENLTFGPVGNSVTVTEADMLNGVPKTLSAFQGQPSSGTVAGFTDTLTTNVAGDFTATIDWGDTTTSAGTVIGASGSFNVSGMHTYADLGSFTVTVTLTDDAPGTATATATSTATVCPLLTIGCPANILKFPDSGQLGAFVNPGNPAFSGGCTPVTISEVRSDGKPLNALFPIGVTLITWTAKDSNGNTATCTQTITVLVPSEPHRRRILP